MYVSAILLTVKTTDELYYAQDSAEGDDTLEQLLKSLGDANVGDGNPEDQLQGLLENMMTQLMSKEVLYEPLKELHEKVRLIVVHDRLFIDHKTRIVPGVHD